MNKKIIVIIVVILLIFVSLDIYLRYESSLPNNVNITITPATNNIIQSNNLTFFINSTGSIKSYLLDASSWTSGAELEYLGPNANDNFSRYYTELTHYPYYIGLVKFNITGNEHIVSSWNGTIMQFNNNKLVYSLAPAGYYKLENIHYSIPAGQVYPTIIYENPIIHVSGIFYNVSIYHNSINVSVNHTLDYSKNISNLAVNVSSSYDNYTKYSNETFRMNNKGFLIINFKNLTIDNIYQETETCIYINTVNGEFFIKLDYGGKIV